MRQAMILTGEINLKTVTDPTVPFGRVTKELGEADLVFANLECLLADPPAAYHRGQAGSPGDVCAGPPQRGQRDADPFRSRRARRDGHAHSRFQEARRLADQAWR